MIFIHLLIRNVCDGQIIIIPLTIQQYNALAYFFFFIICIIKSPLAYVDEYDFQFAAASSVMINVWIQN